jgi:molybdate transport system permease protein
MRGVGIRVRKRRSSALEWAGAPLLLFLALPVLVLVGRALSGSGAALVADPVILQALALSLATTTATLALAVLLGTPLAYVLAHRRFRGVRLVETLIDLPIVLPPAVAGLALLLAFGRRGPLGGPLDALGISLPFTTLAVVLAQLFVAAPLYVRAARAGFATVERELEDAARVDGADETQVFARVTVPLAGPALAAGAVLAWARALGEFGATIMFAGNVQGLTQTLPLAVYAEFQVDLDASIAAGVVLVLAALIVLLLVRVTRWRSAFELRSVG